MCGIVGLAGPVPRGDRDLLIIQRDTLVHRGPDDAGVWWSDDGCVGLAHRRLSILDLSPAGHQPMQDESRRLSIVFNGEIYNHRELRAELESRGYRFRSTSDTEVILAAFREWDAQCVDHLTGMFAFGIYDLQRRIIFLARDRAGEKPLFYRLANDRLVFASELKALLADPEFPRQLDAVSLDCYLAYGYVPADRCILRGVNKLPPASALSFDLGNGVVRTWRYWTLPESCEDRDEIEASDEAGLLDEMEQLLEESVRRQLVADVPVGVLLSGGVDSSLITAMAVRTASRVKTFTVGFPGYGSFDETAHARLIARHFGTEHVELEAGAASVDLLPQLARQFDEPIVDSSMIPTHLLSALVRGHCTVALGGDGGDELFGGYGHYNRMLGLQRRFGWIPLRMRRVVSHMATSALPTGFRGRGWLQSLGEDLSGCLPLAAPLFSSSERRRLAGTDLDTLDRDRRGAEAIRGERIPHSEDLVQRATRMDFENYLAEDILVKVDRASMLNSLEVRAPWLDHRMIEFAFGKVPSRLKATHLLRKILPKRLAQRVLPPGFDLQRKQGFSIPLGDWLKKEEWSGFFREVLLGSGDTLFDKREVQKLFIGQQRGRSNSERLFALVMFELWRREYGISL